MRSEEEMIAYALEIDPALLPSIPTLLADLDELGSDAEQIVDVLAALELGPAPQVTDLGCGKGATAVEIAEELGWPVLGIDLFAPFIDSCRALAERSGVADRCEFLQGNIATLAPRVAPADVAIFAALGDVLGSFEDTIGIVRQYVRPGGAIVISDVFVAEGGSNDFNGFRRYAGRDEMLRRWSAHGDRLVREVRPRDDADGDGPDEDALIQRRAEALGRTRPELRPALDAFVGTQQAENAFVAENFVDVIWVFERR